ncbi:MAG: pyridoxal phosphate-dependent aminotransferase family protein [Truepera sp.]|nr:pyridoxal phosphate-dependent aminotransferase family protein [Truepera sp.]
MPDGVNSNIREVTEAQLASTATKEDDIFAKAFRYTRPEEAEAVGMNPYFRTISAQCGGTVTVDGREMVITGSNDYLGLTQDPRLKEAARTVLNNFGTSCTGSRFLTGTLSLHEILEERLATFLNEEAVLTFSAGYLGCLSVLSALAGRRDIMYFDRENHASLYDGARLSFATLRKYDHGDLDQLEQLLKKDSDRSGGRMIVTDGVFSMNGHIVNLPALVEIARTYGARLVVDDAHSIGVLGAAGRGTAEHFGLMGEVDIIVGTFSKSFASVGGFMAAPRKVVQYIKTHARPFIFTAALPATQMAVVLKALEIIESEPEHRERLWENVRRLHQGMSDLGFDTLGSQTPIVPVLVGQDEVAIQVWRGLWDGGVFTTPAIAPAIPPGQAIIRTSVNANHTEDQIDRVLGTFEVVGRRYGLI